MAKSAKSAKPKVQTDFEDDFIESTQPNVKRKLKVRTVATFQQSSPEYKFEINVPLICIVTGDVTPDSGPYAGKHIGYHVECLETDKAYTIGATAAIKKGIEKAINEGYDVIANRTPLRITWHGKRMLKDGGKTFNDYTVEMVELSDAE